MFYYKNLRKRLRIPTLLEILENLLEKLGQKSESF
jgi:hypothetical protein